MQGAVRRGEPISERANAHADTASTGLATPRWHCLALCGDFAPLALIGHLFHDTRFKNDPDRVAVPVDTVDLNAVERFTRQADRLRMGDRGNPDGS